MGRIGQFITKSAGLVRDTVFGKVRDPSANNEVKKTSIAPVPLNALPEFNTSADVKLSDHDQKLIDNLQESARLLKKNAKSFNQSYQSIKDYYSSEKLFSHARVVALRQEKKSWAEAGNASNFPIPFVEMLSRTYLFLLEDAKTIEEHAVLEKSSETIQAAKRDLEAVFTAAASQFYTHCNNLYLKATDKTNVMTSLLSVCDLFANYVNITFDVQKSTFLSVKQSNKQSSLAVTVESINENIAATMIKAPKAQLDIALGFIQEAFSLFPLLKDKISFSRKDSSSPVTIVDAKDIEKDNQFIQKHDEYVVMCEDYTDITVDTEIARDANVLSDVFDELKKEFDVEHKKIIDALIEYEEKTSNETKEAIARLAKVTAVLKVELSRRNLSANCYDTFMEFKKAQTQLERINEEINQKKTFFHNEYESLKLKFGGKAIDVEKSRAMKVMVELLTPLGMPINAASELESTRAFRDNLALLEREKYLKDILKQLKNDICSDKNMKDHWAKEVYSYFGGASVAIQENKKTIHVKVPHGIAFIKKSLANYSDDVIEKMKTEQVRDLFVSFQKKIDERQAKRSDVIVWCSCFKIKSQARKEPTINFYQKLSLLNIDKVKAFDVGQFTFENATKAIAKPQIVPTRSASPR